MAAPIAAIGAVVAAAGAAVYAAYQAIPEAAKDVAREEIDRAMRGEMDEYMASALGGAFEKIGLGNIDLSNGITPQAVTQAINEGPLAGTGIELTNIFDKEACKRDMMRIGLARAAEAYGLEMKDTSMDGIKASIKEHLSAQLDAQIEAGAGEWLDAVPELKDLARELARATARGWIDASGNLLNPNDSVSMSEYHIKLRERQANYAARHTRVWVEGPGPQGGGGYGEAPGSGGEG